MIKHIILTLLIPFLSYGQHLTSLKDLKLNGKVKKMEVEYIDGEEMDSSMENHNYYFNKKGQLTKYEWEDVPTEKNYTYNNEGVLISFKSLKTYAGGSTEEVMFKRKGNIGSERRFLEHYMYDELVLDKDIKYIYDGNSLLYKTVNTEHEKSYYTYSKNKILTIKKFNKKGITITHFKYDHNTEEELEYLNNKLISKSITSYNNKGLPVKIIISDLDKQTTETIKYTYEYDDKGNYTIQNTFLDGKKEYVEKVKFTYYKD